MGITGLLPFLEKASEKINVKQLANKTVAIDSYCWLHKGAYAVADKLSRGEETDVHIQYCLKYVNLLLSHNIKPILVFDGRHLPAKADTEAKRRENRKAAKAKAIELMRKGKHSEARNYLRRCVDVTHEMAQALIRACREINVDSIVAPYEADGQLAYLNKIGIADYIVTEDSDLILFGCRRILFKLDLNGACVLVDADKLHLAINCRPEKFSMEKFRFMCILSGCDYVDSLPGIGLAKACKFVMMTEETNMMRAMDKIPAYLNMRQLTVSDEYKTNVMKANATFQHMVVYDPVQRRQTRLNAIDDLETPIEFCCNAGEIIDDDTALDLAVGNLNPFSLKKTENWHPDRSGKSIGTKTRRAPHMSIWNRQYKMFTKNGCKPQQSTLTKLVTRTVKVSTKTVTRRSIEAMISDDEESSIDGRNNGEDLINEYITETAQPQKKFKSNETENLEEEKCKNEKTEPTTPGKSRNPFKRKSLVTEECEQTTEITPLNSSLIKNQSPVKCIDYRKLERLSRFSRTLVPQARNTVSRFFHNEVKQDKIETELNGAKREEIVDETKCVEETKNLYMNTSSDSAVSPTEPSSSGESTSSQTSEITKELSKINKESEDSALTISDVEEDQNKPRFLSFSQPKMMRCGSRTTGLTRKKSSSKLCTSSDSKSLQSKLSMFGFEKRSQINHKN